MVALTAGAQPWTWIGTDVGGPAFSGYHTGTPPDVMTVTGGGADIWGTSDQFYYVYTTVEGHSWDAKIRVHDLQGPDWWTKCELMVRVPDASGLPQGPDPFLAAITTPATGQNQVLPSGEPPGAGALLISISASPPVIPTPGCA